MARATVLQFSKEYAEALQEFSNKYSDVDFKIPEKVKKNANKGLELHKQFGGATSVALAAGRHLANNESISVEKVRHIAKYLESHKNKSRDEKSVDSGYVGWQMYGGNDAYEWSTNVVKQLDEIDNKKLSFFGKDEDNRTEKNESKKEDMTVDLKEKDKPKEEEVKEEEMAVEEKKEMLSEDDLKMAAEQKPEEKPEDPKEESEEKSAEEADEEKKEAKEEKMSLDSNLDIAAILAMLEDETEDYRMLVESHTNGNMDFSKLCYALYAKMCKMSEESKVASEDNDAYMSEFEALKKFKVDEEAKKFSYEVESTLNSVSEYMPKEELSKAREESVNFSIDTIDAWKNMVRATAFNFSKDKKPSDGITRIGLPFAGIENRKVNSVWTRD
jgi:chemotaxis protein histidine kinase CheA